MDNEDTNTKKIRTRKHSVHYAILSIQITSAKVTKEHKLLVLMSGTGYTMCVLQLVTTSVSRRGIIEDGVHRQLSGWQMSLKINLFAVIEGSYSR